MPGLVNYIWVYRRCRRKILFGSSQWMDRVTIPVQPFKRGDDGEEEPATELKQPCDKNTRIGFNQKYGIEQRQFRDANLFFPPFVRCQNDNISLCFVASSKLESRWLCAWMRFFPVYFWNSSWKEGCNFSFNRQFVFFAILSVVGAEMTNGRFKLELNSIFSSFFFIIKSPALRD